MNVNKNKRDAIRHISRTTGMSESSIYKILSNPFSFSKETVELVRREAAKYGLTVVVASEQAGETNINKTSHPTLRIGVVIPSRPMYFWREAVAGIEKSKNHPDLNAKTTVQTIYKYYNFPLTSSESIQFFDALREEKLDGLIIFPTSGDGCRDYIEDVSIPTVIFNDTQDYMTEDWFTTHPHFAFIGPDGYDEGRRAASLIQSCGQAIHHLAIICTRHNSSAQISEMRTRGLKDSISSLSPKTRITYMELDPTERIAPSILARRLVDHYRTEEIDCIYITSGVTHIACAAIEKIERRLGHTVSTFVIGHECSSADKRYLLEGRQRGYIKQDVYTQGLVAMRDIVNACVHGTPLQNRLYPSSIFIR